VITSNDFVFLFLIRVEETQY